MDRALARHLLTENLPRVLSASSAVQAAVGLDDDRFRVAVQRIRIRLQMLDYALQRSLEAPEVLKANLDTFEDVPPQTFEEVIEEISSATGVNAPEPPAHARSFLRLAEILEKNSGAIRDVASSLGAHHAEFPNPSHRPALEERR